MREEFQKLAAAGKLQRRHIEQLLALTRTGYVMHRGWGFGRIKSVDTVFSRLVIDFKGKPQHQIDLDFAAEILKPATADDQYTTPPLQTTKLNWKLLPPGEISLRLLRQQFHALAKQQPGDLSFDGSRLQFLLDLKPSHVYAGLDEFDGYLAFLFPGMKGAVLENPTEGNAIYAFDEHWRELSKSLFENAFRVFQAEPT